MKDNLVLQRPKVKSLILRWGDSFGVILKNAISLVGTQVVTSAVGFFYWWLAARRFQPQTVGLASASVSAMILLGTIGVMGFGTLLMGMLRREPDQAGSLIASALVAAGLAGSLIGLLFVWLTSWISSDLGVWSANIWNALLFGASVGLASIVLVVDQSLIGLLRGDLQLWRNTIFALAKLAILWVIAFMLSGASGVMIYGTWFAGNLISCAFLIAYAIFKGQRIWAFWPKIELVHRIGFDALIHHSLNIALQAPGLALPVIVTIVLSAQLNAYFYTSWMIASFVFVGPIALATVLYAVGSVDTAMLSQKFRSTLNFSLAIGVLACSGLFVIADRVLWIFGPDYAAQATWCLRILSLAVFPIMIKNLYVAVYRIRNRIIVATRLVIVGGALELLLAAAGGKIGGVVGLSIGWVIAVFIEGLIMLPTVIQAINPPPTSDEQLPGELGVTPKSV